MSFKELVNDGDGNIDRYIEYTAYRDGVDLDEAASRSLARLFGQLQDDTNSLVIITAFRRERPLPENRAANVRLAHDLRRLGWGYTPVLGYFIETGTDTDGRPEQVRMREELFFASAQGRDGNARGKTGVQSLVVPLLGKYQQEAALMKLPGDDQTFLVFPDGTTSPVGRWTTDPNMLAHYYTRMRTSPPDRPFTFEAAADFSNMTRLAVDVYFRTKRKER